MEEERGQSTKQQHIVFLGNGGAGKTALANTLSGRAYDPSSAITHGVNNLSFGESNNIVLVDFGGQETRRSGS